MVLGPLTKNVLFATPALIQSTRQVKFGHSECYDTFNRKYALCRKIHDNCAHKIATPYVVAKNDAGRALLMLTKADGAG